MTLKDLMTEIEAIFKIQWETRDGRKIPEAEDVQLGNDAVKIDGTVLYADMSDSTGLVDGFKPWFAAEIYKAYLLGAVRIIRENDGEVTAFDGDRVMAVFYGDYKNTSAAKTALKIAAFVTRLNAALKKAYPNTAYTLRQSIGIDTSSLFVAKTGIRNSNDLVWVGRAANYAAKLCSLGDGTYTSHITEAVYKKLNEKAKTTDGKAMWEKLMWDEKGIVIYRSSWIWSF